MSSLTAWHQISSTQKFHNPTQVSQMCRQYRLLRISNPATAADPTYHPASQNLLKHWANLLTVVLGLERPPQIIPEYKNSKYLRKSEMK